MIFTTATDAADRRGAWAFVIVQFALVGLLAISPAGSAWSVPDPWRAVGDVARIGAIVLIIAGAISLGRSLSPLPAPSAIAVLKVNGLFAIVRHPIYAGLIVLAAVWAATSGSFTSVGLALALGALLELKARWEETQLLNRFPDYAHYAATVGRFVPGIGRLEPPGTRS